MQLLERACADLVDNASPRAISYTAVKQRLAGLRAQVDARPTTTPTIPVPLEPPPGRRDTTGAHLAGPEQFSLAALTGNATTADERGQS